MMLKLKVRMRACYRGAHCEQAGAAKLLTLQVSDISGGHGS
jgi:hypothetical protein